MAKEVLSRRVKLVHSPQMQNAFGVEFEGALQSQSRTWNEFNYVL